jgi:hypothetical protein
MNGLFPEDSDERKTYPVFTGFVQYFPSAMAAIAHHSWLGNQKHNPGLPLQWDRAKSGDEADAQLRHLMEGDYVGMGWRAMALLQKHLEANGAPIAPAAVNATPTESQLRNPANWPGGCMGDSGEFNGWANAPTTVAEPPTIPEGHPAERDESDNTGALKAGEVYEQGGAE